jgi:hypothetical protein
MMRANVTLASWRRQPGQRHELQRYGLRDAFPTVPLRQV